MCWALRPGYNMSSTSTSAAIGAEVATWAKNSLIIAGLLELLNQQINRQPGNPMPRAPGAACASPGLPRGPTATRPYEYRRD